jgi:hypothetical protein
MINPPEGDTTTGPPEGGHYDRLPVQNWIEELKARVPTK